MNTRSTYRLLIAVILVGTFMALFERRPTDRGVRATTSERLVPLEPANMTALGLRTAEYSADCERRDAQWYLTAPCAMRAERAAVDRILGTVGALQRRETITPEQQRERGLTLASYGLETPVRRLIVGTLTRRMEIAVGDEAPLGELVYVRVDGGPEVIATERRLLAAIPRSLDELRDRRLLAAEPARIVRLEIKHAGGFAQFARRPDGWRLQQPIEAAVDGRRLAALLASLESARAERFLDRERRVDLATLDLMPDDALLQIRAWTEGLEEPETLLFGKVTDDRPDEAYVRVEGLDFVATVTTGLVAQLTIRAQEFRDRRVFPINPDGVRWLALQEGERKLVLEQRADQGWTMQEPIRGQADDEAVIGLLKRLAVLEAEAIVDEPVTNLAAVRLAPPALAIVAGRSPEVAATNATETAAPRELLTLAMAGVPADGSAPVLVMQVEPRLAFRVPASALREALGGAAGLITNGLALTDPRAFLARTVFGIGANNIKRLTVLRKGIEQSVMRDESGVWVADSPPGSRLVEPVLSDLLATVPGLRAARIEQVGPERSPAFGLDETAASLTLGLTGTTGIQKTLLIGKAAPGGGVYAAIQGQDIVFVLTDAVAAALLRDVVQGAP